MCACEEDKRATHVSDNTHITHMSDPRSGKKLKKIKLFLNKICSESMFSRFLNSVFF
jgi:hypothetical protein